ncbi:MAG: hypothetical protein Q4A33_00795 [Candidatus Saccharibacteria bacterium]|nr:hypothetical protein [Candidatus Saccharibacteria bacterium]
MDQNNNPVDDELQKAIDEITNQTAAPEQPAVFADSVAEPANLSASFDTPAPAPDFSAAPTFDTASFDTPSLDAPVMTDPIEPIGPFDATSFDTPAEEPANDPIPTGDFVSSAIGSDDGGVRGNFDASGVTAKDDMTGAEATLSNDLKDIKDAALKDLIPVLDELTEIDASEKYKLCIDAYEKERDPAILKTALSSAKQISDQKERATALFNIVKAN